MTDFSATEMARLFYKRVQGIQSDTEHTTLEKLEGVYRLINKIFLFATKEEKLRFADLSTRIAFVGHKYNIPNQELYDVYFYRKKYLNKAALHQEDGIPNTMLLEIGLYALSKSIKNITKVDIPNEVLNELLPRTQFAQYFQQQAITIQDRLPYARCVVSDIDKEQEQLIATYEENPSETVRIQYNIIGRNDDFNGSIDMMQDIFGFPLSINLLDVEIDEQGIFRPKGFVILPDYLVDVTSISECFDHDGYDAKSYLLNKFNLKTNSIPLTLGNIANFFLDELLSNPEQSFDDLFLQTFTHNPLGFSVMEDRDIRDIHTQARQHFYHLKDTIQRDFKAQGIDEKDSYLEPSFYSKNYGIQGRLDLWHKKEDGTAAIVELKSGSPFKPNKQGLNRNHYTQTLLYDLLVKSVYKDIQPTNFILYSKVGDSRLRFAQVSKTHQMEAMRVRNAILSYEFRLTKTSANNSNPIHYLRPQNAPDWKGFKIKNLEDFDKAFSNLDELEKKYFQTMTGFIAREHFASKIGGSKAGDISGQTNLWAKTLEDKQQDFSILSHLEIATFQDEIQDTIISFHKTADTNHLANFRVGDICVLYPQNTKDCTVLNHQIFKCNIIAMEGDRIDIRLRSKQHNKRIFNAFKLWNLEHDLYDSSFTNQYKELVSFAKSSKEKRDLLLGRKAPIPPTQDEVQLPEAMTTNQKLLFQNLVNQGDLYLLWGPPGTGKTNMMLKHLVGYLMDNTTESILLLTYTNRAADEICSAIEAYASEMRNQYFRIGSRYSTSPDYQDRLLNNLIKDCSNRKAVKQVIKSHRIVVATVASMVSRKELFAIKDFQRLIIDEASQITESLLCGLLPQFPKVTMIGDHKQLPAVTTQNEAFCLVNDEDLQAIGIQDLRSSLFERLFLLFKAKGYDYAYGQLTEQGRMHQDIMQFASEQFYEGKLNILPEGIAHRASQLADLNLSTTPLGQLRVLFLDTKNEHLFEDKTNPIEAKKVVALVQKFQALYQDNGQSLALKDIGIITPFRAQIACIRAELQAVGIEPNNLTIDTVERYQGGAREVIIISTCVSSSLQLGGIVSKRANDPTDRKLNVAMTRARKHLVIVGNKSALSYDKNYRMLIERYEVVMD